MGAAPRLSSRGSLRSFRPSRRSPRRPSDRYLADPLGRSGLRAGGRVPSFGAQPPG